MAKKPKTQEERDAEAEQMKQAIFDALSSWAALESELGSLMGSFFDYVTLGEALYFTPASVDTRMALITACFNAMHYNTGLEDPKT